MAGLTRLRTRDGVQLVTRTGPDGRERAESFHIVAFEQLRGATVTAIRILAEESRELILDRLYAQRPQAPGQARIERPKPLRRSDIPFVERRAANLRRLADRTVEDKAAAEQDGRKLIKSGEYTYGIEVFKSKRSGQIYYTVRPKPGPHPERGITHRVLAAMHEFGTSKMPKRPHWGPALRTLKRVMRARGLDARAVALRQAIRRVR